MLDAYQRRLEDRFEGLKEEREGEVFFIEHGLSQAEIGDLTAAARAAIRRTPVSDPLWQRAGLPLIVIASEVGYAYRGTGTNFWPLLEERLEARFDAAERDALTRIFRYNQRQHQGAVPKDSPWVGHFHMIAWPITHALVPLELHRQLAAMLAALPAGALARDDQSLFATIKRAAYAPTARFESFLTDDRLVVALTRALLGDVDEGALSPEIIARIAGDLRDDEVAHQDIALARQNQRRAAPSRPRAEASGPRGRAQAGAARPPRAAGQLWLRCGEGGLALEVSFPPPPAELAARLRRALRVRRFSPRLWGVTERIPAERLLAGIPVELRLTEEALPGDAPLLPGLEELALEEGDLTQALQALTLTPPTPLLFGVSADGERARAVQGQELLRSRKYMILLLKEERLRYRAALSEAHARGPLGPYQCYELSLDAPSVDALLRGYGLNASAGLSAAIVGAPPLRWGTREYQVGDAVALSLRGEAQAGARVELGDARAALGAELVRLPIIHGERDAALVGERGRRLYPLSGLEEAPPKPSAPCWITLDAPEWTVQALLGHRLTLLVEAVAPLRGLEITLTVEAGARRYQRTAAVTHLPWSLSAADVDGEPFWERLLGEDAREQLRGVDAVTARARLHAGGATLARAERALEQRLSACWWVTQADEQTLQSEQGELEHGYVPAATPAMRPSPSEAREDAHLLAPLDLERDAFAASAEFTTRCHAPRSLRLQYNPQKPQLKRQRRALGRAVGLEDLVEAYLRWALAESTSTHAELRRRQVTAALDGWLAELTCGARWVALEAREVRSPWELLRDVCARDRVGLDGFLKLTQPEANKICEIAVAALRRAYSTLWRRLDLAPGDDDSAPLTEADAERFDNIFLEAHKESAKSCDGERAKALLDADVGEDLERWQRALDEVRVSAALPALAAAVLPTHQEPPWLSLDFTPLRDEDLHEELRRWSRATPRAASFGPAPSDATLEIALALWLSPERVVAAPWREALDALLVERPLARAARYLALRARAARVGRER